MILEFPIERDELLLIFNISHSLSYVLHENGKLTTPENWCGTAKRFCLRNASQEFAMMNGFQKPTDETILHYWNSIMQIRFQKQLIELANKKAKRTMKKQSK
jgi:hypothetical protein